MTDSNSFAPSKTSKLSDYKSSIIASSESLSSISPISDCASINTSEYSSYESDANLQCNPVDTPLNGYKSNVQCDTPPNRYKSDVLSDMSDACYNGLQHSQNTTSKGIYCII